MSELTAKDKEGSVCFIQFFSFFCCVLFFDKQTQPTTKQNSKQIHSFHNIRNRPNKPNENSQSFIYLNHFKSFVLRRHTRRKQHCHSLFGLSSFECEQRVTQVYSCKRFGRSEER